MEKWGHRPCVPPYYNPGQFIFETLVLVMGEGRRLLAFGRPATGGFANKFVNFIID